MTIPDAPLPYPAELFERMERDIAGWLKDNPLSVRSAFRRIEALLQCGSDYQHALGYVADRAAMSGYVDRIDFLFSEACPEHAEALSAFLEGSGGQMSEILDAEEIRRCEHVLFCVLALCVAIRQDNPDDAECPVSWSMVLEVARKLAAQTFGLQPAPAPTS